ncbi:MAG: mevalonate kinase [candidate division WS6 bacterium OLB20]|uniref:Mevalonate kinase n=1 Tax=candidate division WS6 bacterium OLB20 TaxID=1617426 RepID=A0A136LX49_9BACT|nr:MAG: mevalonate kinase [candidate division WS6 bacterium OLB20]
MAYELRHMGKAFPGKIIVNGEHAVVHGHPALLATFGKTVTAEARIAGDNIVFSDHTFGIKSFQPGILKAGDEVLLEQHEYALPLMLVREFFRYCGLADRGLKITAVSDIPIGGFGSSTAYAAAVLSALSEEFAKELSDQERIDLLTRAETAFHGRVSGADQALIIRGGMIRYQNKDSGPVFTPVSAATLLQDVIVINTGRPEDATGTVVAWVGKRLQERPHETTEIFTRLGQITDEMISDLQQKHTDSMQSHVAEAGELLIKLGIVRPEAQELIRKLAKLGAAVKITGAGALQGRASGALLCLSDDYGPVERFLQKQGVEYYRTALGVS